ncbi:MAG: translation elongation factor Ts [Candidatus Pacebacteria bacterium]|nr:translation elongation factor Ts [Candidatus Paceibacterota bacterium]
MVSIELIKQLRQETDISLSQCKKALEEAEGDIEKAKEILKKQGGAVAAKKSDREVNVGIIDAYIHAGGQVGVMITLLCETDFVARGDAFKELNHELLLQIASMAPKYVSEEDITEEILNEEMEAYKAQLEGENKPEEIKENIIKGKLDKFKKESCLLSQPWVKDNNITIQDLINDYIAKLGENIKVKEFIRYEL